jgi:hypothetical protein
MVIIMRRQPRADVDVPGLSKDPLWRTEIPRRLTVMFRASFSGTATTSAAIAAALITAPGNPAACSTQGGRHTENDVTVPCYT